MHPIRFSVALSQSGNIMVPTLDQLLVILILIRGGELESSSCRLFGTVAKRALPSAYLPLVSMVRGQYMAALYGDRFK